MSDSRLRELERRWKETGSPDDEAAYLLERVRVGDLTWERLDLAAYCGHEGALACATARPGAERRPDLAARIRASLARFGVDSTKIEGLTRFGHPVVVRGALSVARQVLAVVGPPETPAGDLARMCVARGEAWLGCPCEAHAREVTAGAASLLALVNEALQDEGMPVGASLQWAATAALAAGSIAAVADAALAEQAAIAARMFSLDEERGRATAAVWASAATTLIEWALGPAHSRRPDSHGVEPP